MSITAFVVAIIFIIIRSLFSSSEVKKPRNTSMPTFGGATPEDDEVENPIPTFAKRKPYSTTPETVKHNATKPFLQTDEGCNHNHPHHVEPIEVEEVEPFAVDAEELKKGIIYSEILNRREI